LIVFLEGYLVSDLTNQRGKSMPVAAIAGINWREYAQKQEDYRRKLIKKGVVDGGSKMLNLMCRKFKRD
jgi:hypothetical protein